MIQFNLLFEMDLGLDSPVNESLFLVFEITANGWEPIDTQVYYEIYRHLLDQINE